MGAILTTTDAAIVRGILGTMLTEDRSDVDLMSDAIVIPAEQEVLAMCPSDTTYSPEQLESVRLAVAYVVAAMTTVTMQRIKSASIGDESVTFSDTAVDAAADAWRRQASAIMGRVCPIALQRSVELPVFFGTLRGRRGG